MSLAPSRYVHPGIERLQRICAASPGVLSLGGGLPAPELFPEQEIAQAAVRALRTSTTTLQYGWPEGDERLRAWIARRASRGGLRVDPGSVIVTSGAQQAIGLAAAALLREGDRVDVDPETYPGALDVFRGRGVSPEASPLAARAHYVMPGISNPRGLALSRARRAALLASASPIMADEAYAELRFDGRPAESLRRLAPHRVWQIGTFSKTLCPGLRIGWLIPPPQDHGRALQEKHDRDLQSNGFTQALVSQLLDEWDFDRHLERARALYARRADVLLTALARWLPSFRVEPPQGGFSVLAETGEAGDDAELLAVATEHGVSFDPGRLFRPSEASAPLAMRLCYCNLDERRIAEAVRRLARAWAAWRSLRNRRAGAATAG